MKRVVFVDMLEKDFEQRGTEFEECQEMFLPDAYDLINWYQEQDDVIVIERWWRTKYTFYYYILKSDCSTEKRIVCVIDVEQLEHNDEIDGKDE